MFKCAQIPGELRCRLMFVGTLSMEFVTCHLSGAKNFEVGRRFLENLYNPVVAVKIRAGLMLMVTMQAW
jgi:hypothetical protein